MSATSDGPVIVWFRRDLRLSDHQALCEAVAAGRGVVPVFIDSAADDGGAPAAAASRWWLHHSLASLDEALASLGSRLILRKGAADLVMHALAREVSASAIYWHRCYEPATIARDKLLKASLLKDGFAVKSFNGSLLREPWAVENGSGKPYRVFTPYWRSCAHSGDVAPPLAAPATLPAPRTWPASIALEELQLLPKISWDQGMAATWKPGEASAQQRLRAFREGAVTDYTLARDLPAVSGTSSLSPSLAFGEVSPRQVWHAFRDTQAAITPGLTNGSSGAAAFLRQIGWREFAYHLLYHFPDTVDRPLRPEFEHFPWDPVPDGLRRWQRGETGYPIVDAGMRQLWTTGWMHNRVRLLVGSFLVKDLLVPWQDGAAWFWDTLVDADLANNTLGWQWIGGCGADASPYFRIFNPTTQSEKFDASAVYIRRWLPVLSRLPHEWIHRPASAPAAVLATAGVKLGQNYPLPIVDHAVARERAMIAYHRMQKLHQAQRQP